MSNIAINKKRLKPFVKRPETFLYGMESAEGGTRTPTPFRVQRPERCVSTNFTTSADLVVPSLGTWPILQHLT